MAKDGLFFLYRGGNMCVYEPIRHPDGTFFLTKDQREALRSNGYDSQQIYSALLKVYEKARPDASSSKPVATESNLSPCPTCGGIDFITTGTCHACATCGESQGCS